MDVSAVLRTLLPNFDEDLLNYIISILQDVSDEERKSANVLKEVVAPFLIDSSFVANELEAEELCQRIAVSFGGSGYKSHSAVLDESPALLSMPIKMNDLSLIKQEKKTYGGAVIANQGNASDLSMNTAYESSSIPVTSKELRKQRKQNEQLQVDILIY